MKVKPIAGLFSSLVLSIYIYIIFIFLTLRNALIEMENGDKWARKSGLLRGEIYEIHKKKTQNFTFYVSKIYQMINSAER